MPAGPISSSEGMACDTSISISRSSSSPWRSRLRNFCRVADSLSLGREASASKPKPDGREGGISTSRMRSSAASCAASSTRRLARSRACLTATSARSRMMESTSRPT
jgi:hypothetical protein